MSIALNLLVLRVSDLEHSRQFYEAMGITFAIEKHGEGPEHLAAELSGCVFELYPQGDGALTTRARIGFQVSSLDELLASFQMRELESKVRIVESTYGRQLVFTDPDGHKIEVSQSQN